MLRFLRILFFLAKISVLSFLILKVFDDVVLQMQLLLQVPSKRTWQQMEKIVVLLAILEMLWLSAELREENLFLRFLVPLQGFFFSPLLFPAFLVSVLTWRCFRSFCAQLLANAQAAAVAENNKVSPLLLSWTDFFLLLFPFFFFIVLKWPQRWSLVYRNVNQ